MNIFRLSLLLAALSPLTGWAVPDVKINDGGRLIVKSELKVNSGDVIVAANGRLYLDGGKITAANVRIETDGLMTGGGILIGDLTNDGTLALDDPASTLDITGKVLLNSAGTLKLGLGGLTTGDFSTLTSTGTMTVGGTLVVAFINGFETGIRQSDTFTLISSASPILGAFSNIASAGSFVPENGLGSMTVDYSTDLLVLNAFTPNLPVVTLIQATGDVVSGEPATTKFQTFGVPAINGAGHFSFASTLTTSSGSKSAMFGGSSAAIAFQGGDEPLGPGGPRFDGFGDPMSNGLDSITFTATLTGDGVTSSNRSGLWTTSGGSLALVARAGDNAFGVTDAKIREITAAGFTEEGAIPYIATIFGKGAAGGMRRALWVWESSGTHLLLRENSAITFDGEPERTLETFSALAPSVGSPGHARSALANGVLARVSFTGGLDAIAEVTPTVKRLVVKAGDVVPTSPAGAKFASFGTPGYNSRGDIAFLAKLTKRTGGVASHTDRAIYADSDSADFDLVARTGDLAPGAEPALFTSLSDPVYNSERDVAFLAEITKRLSGIWWLNASDLQSVAIEGKQASDVPNGALWDNFLSLALPDGTRAGPVFLATLQPGKAGINGSNKTGIWAVDFTGETRLIVRTGNSVSIPGVPAPKQIASLTILPSVLVTSDHARSYNANRQFAFRAIFTDKTQAIYRVDMP